MELVRRRKRAVLAGLTAAALGTALTIAAAPGIAAPRATATHPHIDCSNSKYLCTEVHESDQAFGHYVGHDEPSVLFYSKQSGSGNQMVYRGVLPKEPAPTNVPGKRSYSFELTPAFWFGMVMCDTQSYPETSNTCIPDSDTNITKPGSPIHAGAAYMELQFYPPGYVPQWTGYSCSATQWCVALTIYSDSLNPVTGQELNKTCQARVGSIEYANFAYLTYSGVPQGPPNPMQFSPTKSGTPNPAKVLFLHQRDHFTVTMHDTQHGLQAIVQDTTTGRTGSMTASAANGFGQVKFAPKGTSCINLPYDFHPMYSTSQPSTTVPWAAATYNVAMDTEIGHFDYCSAISAPGGGCTGNEGVGSNTEPWDSDDYACFPGSMSSLIHITGCEGANIGYDGTSYLRDWPNGSRNTPTPFFFTSPLTGPAYNMNYSQVAFNTDLPAIEGDIGTCNIFTGKGCTLIPPTDDNNAPADFYPYYTTGKVKGLGACAWAPGQDVPGFTTANYGQNLQYGKLLKVAYAGLNGTIQKAYQDYQGIQPSNPCPAS